MQLSVHIVILLSSYWLIMNLKRWNKYAKSWYSIDSRATFILFKLSIGIYPREEMERVMVTCFVKLTLLCAGCPTAKRRARGLP